MKPLKTYQPNMQTAIQIVQNYRDTADYWVRYYYSKTWDTDEQQWKLVRLILDIQLDEVRIGD